MTRFARVAGAECFELAGDFTDAAGVQYGLAYLASAEPEDLARLGVQEIVEDLAEPGPGQRLVGRFLRLVEGVPTISPEFAPIPLAERLAGLLVEIDAHRDQLIDGGFTHDGHRFQSRPSDRENIAALGADAAEAIRDGAQPGDYLWHPEFPAGFGFITADNVTVPLDAFAMRDLRGRGTRYKAALTFHARGLKDAALAAVAAEDVAAFDLVVSTWREGWPA